jgi:cellulose synthase/poly-beta-1,6-N-acetylglucosamine synthase-like glycosyltransferase
VIINPEGSSVPKLSCSNYSVRQDDRRLRQLSAILKIPLVSSNTSIWLPKDIVQYNDEMISAGCITFQVAAVTTSIITIFDLNNAITQIKNNKNNSIILVDAKHFYTILEDNFKEYYLLKALYFLDFASNKKTSKNLNYPKIIILVFCAMSIFIFCASHLFIGLNTIFYFFHSALKMMLVCSHLNRTRTLLQTQQLSSFNKPYPIYSILLPMYKEVAKFSKLLTAIAKLNYPKECLDVKIILEQDDVYMLREVSLYNLPEYIHIVKVPNSMPKTKPKALNYAMNFARGEYVVVYDAEDEPHPDQLTDSLLAFRALPPEYICLQSPLNFYNAEENLLTLWLSIEYSLWFNLILKGLNYYSLPMPLGGTSNHFKVSRLKELCFWDSYNVTEDADLGLKIYHVGYKSKLNSSFTLEEAPPELKIWLYQRVRWIKGFMQTFLVYALLAPKQDWRMIFVTYAFIALSVHSFLVLPFITFSIFWVTNNILLYYIYSTLIISLVFLMLSAYIAIKKINADIKQNKSKWWLGFLLFPIYFILHSIASYMAIFELLTKPFKWNKTTHGLSKVI